MRTMTRYFIPVLASAGATAALVLAPLASAQPSDEVSNLPACTTTGEGGQFTGTQTTQCQSPGNVQIAATAPDPVYLYPWDDEYYGSALMIGGGPIDGPIDGGGRVGGGGFGGDGGGGGGRR